MTHSKIFQKKKPIIGVVHLDYLEGENFKGISYVIQKALGDIKSLQRGGIDGILIENWKELSLGEFVSPETAKNLTGVVIALAKYAKVPFGVNVLNNDYKVAFSVAKLTGASFVDLDVFVDKVKSDFQNNKSAIYKPFIISPKPKKIWDYARSIGAEDIPLFVFVQPKHYIMLEGDKTIEESTKQAVESGASAVLVTKATGFAPTLDLIKRTKKAAASIPVGIGSGFSAKNAKDILPFVDFAVVGTSIRMGGVTSNPIDPVRVCSLMKVVNRVRNH
jgi:membrane complex biogenesis BtpA family protein